MILGLTPFTLIHVLISLTGIFAGLVVLQGMIASRRMDGWTLIFVVFTLLTSITGFFFPFHGVTPAVTLGIVSLVTAVPTLLARYAFAMRGVWRWVWAIGAVALQYFNSFVLVVQLFLKVPALHTLSPTGGGPAFGGAQGVLLLFYVVTGIMAARRFRP